MNTKTALLLVLGVLAGVALVHYAKPTPPSGSPAASTARPAVDLPAPADASDSRAPARIAYVDLATVFVSSKQAKALEAELSKCKAQGFDQLKPLQLEGDKLGEQLKNMAKDAPERPALQTQFEQKAREYAQIAEPWERDLAMKRFKGREKIYVLARSTIERIAKERGVDMVLSDIEDPRPDMTGANSEQVIQAFESYMGKVYRKSVLYSGRDADLTQPVLDAMNAEPGS